MKNRIESINIVSVAMIVLMVITLVFGVDTASLDTIVSYMLMFVVFGGVCNVTSQYLHESVDREEA